MPTYLYFCERDETDGGHGEFEDFHGISDEAKLKECPFCRKENIETPVKRLLSGGSGRGIVKLEGQDFIASVKQDAERVKKEVYSNENQYANILGTDKYQALQQKIDKSRR